MQTYRSSNFCLLIPSEDRQTYSFNNSFSNTLKAVQGSTCSYNRQKKTIIIVNFLSRSLTSESNNYKVTTTLRQHS